MKKIWLIAFLFNVSFVLLAAEDSSSPLPLYLQKNMKANFSVKTDLLHANVHLIHDKVSWGTSLSFAGTKNAVTMKAGNLAFSGSISNLNTPGLSSTVSPFTMAKTSATGISCDFENSESFSKPLSFFLQYSFTNKNKNKLIFNTLYIPENKTLAISNGYSWNINKVIQTRNDTSIDKTNYNLFLTAGLFPYERLESDSWTLSQPFYQNGFQTAFCLEGSIIKDKIKNLFNINLYFTPYGNPLITLRNENTFKINNTILNISEYFNYGIFIETEKHDIPFSTNENDLKECFQIKLNIQNEAKTKNNNSLKKGFTIFGDFDLYNAEHILKTSYGIRQKIKNITNSISSNFTFSCKPDIALYLDDFNIKYGLSFSINRFSLSSNLNFLFYPPENLFYKNNSENIWDSQQSLSFGIKTSGKFYMSSNISATLIEKQWKAEQMKIEYSMGFYFKEKWFTGSLLLKDHITCEF